MIVLTGIEGTKFAVWVKDIEKMQQRIEGDVEVYTETLVIRCRGSVEELVILINQAS